MSRTLLLIGLGAVLCAPSTALAAKSWTGTWDSSTGAGGSYVFKFTQSGSTVTGEYNGTGTEAAVRPIEDGQVSGDGGTLSFKTDNGRYTYLFTQNADGDSFTGKWGYDVDTPGNYSGGTYTGERRMPAASKTLQVQWRALVRLHDETLAFHPYNDPMGRLYRAPGTIVVQTHGELTAGELTTSNGNTVAELSAALKKRERPEGIDRTSQINAKFESGRLEVGPSGLIVELEVSNNGHSSSYVSNGTCGLGGTATISVYDANTTRNDTLRVGPWSPVCRTHTHALRRSQVNKNGDTYELTIKCRRGTKGDFTRAACRSRS